MEIGITTRKGSTALCRTIDEEVRLNVHIRLAFRIATHDVSSVRPVVDDVIGILVDALDLEVTGAVVHQQYAVEM